MRSRSHQFRAVAVPRKTKRGASIETPRQIVPVKLTWLGSLRHVLGSRTLLTLDNVELYRVAFSKGLEARARDCAVVNEAVLLPVVWGDETKALRVVEPLHFAGRTHFLLLENLCLGERNTPDPRQSDTRVSLTPHWI